MKKLFGNFLGSKRQELNVSDDYKKWRELIFSLKSESADVSSKEIDRVFGVVMDYVQLDQSTNTFLGLSQTAFASGESSIKATTGAGVIGLGVNKDEEKIFTSAQQLVELAQQLLGSADKTTDYSLPKVKVVRFFFLTTSGEYFIDSHIEKIEQGDKRVYEMFNGFMFIRRYADSIMKQAQKQNPEKFSSS